MAQVGLDDTALNREAATEEIYRARADALLASAVKARKPKLSGGVEPERTRVAAAPVAPPARPGLLWAADAEQKPAMGRLMLSEQIVEQALGPELATVRVNVCFAPSYRSFEVSSQ